MIKYLIAILTEARRSVAPDVRSPVIVDGSLHCWRGCSAAALGHDIHLIIVELRWERDAWRAWAECQEYSGARNVASAQIRAPDFFMIRSSLSTEAIIQDIRPIKLPPDQMR